MSKQTNPNLFAMRAIARELGVTVLSAVEGRKHLKVTFRTNAGATFNMSVHRGKVDPYKMEGWMRQQAQRADMKL